MWHIWEDCWLLFFALFADQNQKTGAQAFCSWTRYLVHARGGGIDEFDLVHQITYVISLLDLVD